MATYTPKRVTQDSRFSLAAFHRSILKCRKSEERDLRYQLRAHGCTFERPGRGDHEIWYSPITGRRFPVDQFIVSRHTANAVLKQAGIPKQF